MMWALAALLLVQPVLDEPGTLRLVATGPPGPVAWVVDGRSVGSSAAREAVSVQVGAGPHAVVASAEHKGPWQVVVRLDQPGPGIAYTPAWTASSAGDGPRVIPGAGAPWVAAAVALAAWAQSKRP
jgi:hypothetical protein